MTRTRAGFCMTGGGTTAGLQMCRRKWMGTGPRGGRWTWCAGRRDGPAKVVSGVARGQLRETGRTDGERSLEVLEEVKDPLTARKALLLTRSTPRRASTTLAPVSSVAPASPWPSSPTRPSVQPPTTSYGARRRSMSSTRRASIRTGSSRLERAERVRRTSRPALPPARSPDSSRAWS